MAWINAHPLVVILPVVVIVVLAAVVSIMAGWNANPDDKRL